MNLAVMGNWDAAVVLTFLSHPLRLQYIPIVHSIPIYRKYDLTSSYHLSKIGLCHNNENDQLAIFKLSPHLSFSFCNSHAKHFVIFRFDVVIANVQFATFLQNQIKSDPTPQAKCLGKTGLIYTRPFSSF